VDSTSATLTEDHRKRVATAWQSSHVPQTQTLQYVELALGSEDAMSIVMDVLVAPRDRD
jgi:hypothetical protein